MIPLVGTVKFDGTLYRVERDFPERYQLHLAKFKDKRVVETVKKFYKTNTPKQKAYLHGVVIPLACAAMGYMRHERDHVYRTFKSEYLKAYDERGREYIRELRENSDDPADTVLVSWFTDQIRDRIAIEFNIPIPDPDKNYDKGMIEEWVMEIERG